MNTKLNSTPTFDRRLPFPLENVEQELIKAFDGIQSIHDKLQHCKQYNGLSSDKPRQKHIDKMLYKTTTVLSLVKALAKDLNEMYL
jgi:hypothetical protein